MRTDELRMKRALELARKGAGFVSPNPLVGCVIVKDGKVIAEGYHKKFGEPHAEVEALKNIRNTKTTKLRNAVVYVNLEPCCHYGQTPPCVDALIAAGVKRVVIGMKDPNPLVAGRSIRKLRQAGIQVAVGVLKEACQELNEAFIKWITTGRPFVLLKVAVTLDGALTLKKGTETPLGSRETMRRVHQLRQEYDAIAVGVNTVLVDDPRLTARVTPSSPPPTRGRTRFVQPVRVIFDTHLRVPEKSLLLRQSGQTIIFTGPEVAEKKLQKITKNYNPAPQGCRVRIISLPLDRSGHVSIKAALKWLGGHDISSVMVEGGAELATSFLKQKLADKVMLVITPHLASDPAAPRLLSALDLVKLSRQQWEAAGKDVWLRGYPVGK